MWPVLLDMTKDECRRTLRRLELEAYGNIVSALRAQGGFTTDKQKLLKDLASALHIPQERHRAEIRRAVNDEKLATVAHCMTGEDRSDEWALEGRRLIPLMPRLAPQTAYSVIADDEANKISIENEKLPLPANTERKRTLQTSTTETLNKNVQHRDVHFRVPSDSTNNKGNTQSNLEEIISKKRKSSLPVESSTLAQHLMMGQPKISRVQQIYRQKTKAMLKTPVKHRSIHQISTPNIQKMNINKTEDEINNIIQEVPIPLPKTTPQIENKLNTQVTTTNEVQITKNKPAIISSALIKPVTISTNSVAGQPVTSTSNPEMTPTKSIKICPTRKVITNTARTPLQPQKVIIVSSPQGTTPSSILHRTLSSIPFVKTLSMKSFDKIKVLNNVTSSTTVNQKPKLLTVQTKMKSGAPGKQVSIPFQGVQLQALHNKGAIKMVPLTTTAKGITKSGIINTTTGSVYIMNSNTTIPVVTTTTSNVTPLVSSKSDTEANTSNIIILKNELIKPAVNLTTTQNINTVENEPTTEPTIKQDSSSPSSSKSSVLAEILKASGVLSNDESDPNENDIERQITQFTEIPNSIPIKVNSNTTQTSEAVTESTHTENSSKTSLDDSEVEEATENSCENDLVKEKDDNLSLETVSIENIIENSESVGYEQNVLDVENNGGSYVILEENENQSEPVLLTSDQSQTVEEVVDLMGSLDPETGLYSMKTTQDFELMQDVEIENNQSQIETTDNYVIQMESLQNSDLDMPSLTN